LSKSWFDRWLFSKIVGFNSPYSATVGVMVEQIEVGSSRLSFKESRSLHNPFRSIHAAALLNAGELASGMCVLFGLNSHPEMAGRQAIVTRIEISYFKKARGKIVVNAHADVRVSEARWQQMRRHMMFLAV